MGYVKAINWADNKINIRVPLRSEQIEIEEAVMKMNKDATDGATTFVSTFMRAASIRRAREINGTG